MEQPLTQAAIQALKPCVCLWYLALLVPTKTMVAKEPDS